MKPAAAAAFSGFTFEGRIARKPYWWALLICAALTQVPSETSAWPWTLLAIALQFIVIAYRACLSARRLHDIGLSAWWRSPLLAIQLALALILLLVPKAAMELLLAWLGDPRLPEFVIIGLGGAILLFDGVIGFIPGQQAVNRYGEPPAPGLILGRIFR